MTKLAVYDPPMCCSTGVCGPAVDPTLPRVSADLDWLKRQGVEVERYNLAQQPSAFASTPAVTSTLREHGSECLPLVLVDGRVASRGVYPTRDELARMVGLDVAGQPETPRAAASTCCSSPGVVTIGGVAPGPEKCC
ncbi:arsenite efflux transporter metallochaperone ArsD [Paludisphaera soli]|uniref:arsenite efflux transporter metallochaperone ArsD n=1 Tax=Paludisphaera soli TaxID=2712865 RepID=UPI0013ED340D|nr:arsenite efflux transporter metallochaperone ArsD [Paludisphaera soli]